MKGRAKNFSPSWEREIDFSQITRCICVFWKITHESNFQLITQKLLKFCRKFYPNIIQSDRNMIFEYLHFDPTPTLENLICTLVFRKHFSILINNKNVSFLFNFYKKYGDKTNIEQFTSLRNIPGEPRHLSAKKLKCFKSHNKYLNYLYFRFLSNAI